VMGNAGLALAELPSGSSAVESIRQIEVAAKHAADLTRQLLAYAGKGSVSIREIEVDGLIEEMIQLLRLGVPREIALRSQLSPERLLVEGDISQIRQVLMNIVINGAEAIGPRPGSITIATRSCWIGPQELRDLSIRTEIAEGRYVAIDVTDTGGGMDEATLQRIFEPFFTTKISGRGLGLAAVIGIVCAHRGAMKIHSAPGEGSTFTVLLPSIPTALVDHEELAPVASAGASA
jgi:two-component system, cell cycle sensor histidine kinase and response regulator CckA